MGYTLQKLQCSEPPLNSEGTRAHHQQATTRIGDGSARAMTDEVHEVVAEVKGSKQGRLPMPLLQAAAYQDRDSGGDPHTR